MNYTNLLRELADIATRAAKRIAEAQADPHKAIDIYPAVSVLTEATQAISAIETATRPHPAGLTAADVRAIADALAGVRHDANGGE